MSNARWFYGKKRKIGKGHLYLTENQSSWNEMCCDADNHNTYVTHVQKNFQIRTSIKQLLTKMISNFHEIAPNSTYSQKS